MTRKKPKKPSNQFKTISVEANKMSVIYTDTNKHYVYKLENQTPTKELVLFGKVYKGQRALSSKDDFLSPTHRRILNDILYSKHRYTDKQIKEMPLIRQYYILDVARKVEKVLYNWKKEIISTRLDNLLLKLFPHSKFMKQFVDVCKENPVGTDVSRTDIRTLVSEQEIVEYLRLKGLFPKQ
jgi:hypothetical protein